MNTRLQSHQCKTSRAGFTLVECLVVVFLLFLAMVLVARFTLKHGGPPEMQRGCEMYRAIFAKVLDDPWAAGADFPTSAGGFASSSQYFVHLVTNGTLNVDFAYFSGRGLPMYRTKNPTRFKSDGNAWSVVLDVFEQNASYPFLVTRNLLPAATNVPPQSAALTLAMLGETGKGRKLEFNTKAGVVITKAGTGFLIKQRDFTGVAGSMSRLNSTDVSKPILRP